MCTVSFLPSAEGFFLAMNRDEQISRPAGRPPGRFAAGARQATYPWERGGGTWIGVNDAGVAFALLNWYARPQLSGGNLRSRGKIIPELLAVGSAEEALNRLGRVLLTATNPFRLIVVEAGEGPVEIGWSGERLIRQSFPRERTHWFSSAHDESEAARQRGSTCSCAANRSEPDSLSWLRSLHRSHHPERGPFSICMHRLDARTVSYSEISVTGAGASLLYLSGAPCERGPIHTQGLHLAKNIRPLM